MSYSIGRNALNTYNTARLTNGTFNGIDNYIGIPDNDNLSFTNQMTIEAFFNLRSYFVVSAIFFKFFGGATSSEYALLVLPTGKLELILCDNGGFTNWTSYDSAINTILLNQDYHIAITLSGTTVNFYVNGQLVVNTPTVHGSGFSVLGNTTRPVDVFRDQVDGTFTKGKLYFTRLYNRALTQSEVTAHYNNGRPDLYILPFADFGASQTELNNGYNFTSGWTASSATIDNATQFTTTNFGGLIFKNVSINTISKKYRIHLAGTTTSARLQIINASGDVFYDNITGTFDITTECLWVSNTDVRIALRAYTVSGAVTNITTFTVTAIGEVACHRFNEGAGYQIKDYSGNNLHGTLYGTYDNFWQNSKQFATEDFIFTHDLISSSSATTPIFKLSANYRIKEVFVETTVAFDTDNTLSLGITGTDNWLFSVTGTNAIVPQYSGMLDKSLSPSVETQIWIKKAGASTTGTVKIKVRMENLLYRADKNDIL